VTSTGITPPASRLAAGTLYTLLAAAGFSAVSTFTSIALGQGVALANVLMWRYALGAAVLVAFLVLRQSPRLPRRDGALWLVVGGGGQALLVGLALSSLRFIDVATLAFLFYTYPAWVALVQAVLRDERLTAPRLAALALSFGGIAMIAGKPGGAPGAGVAWQGIALALGAAVVYGVYIPAMRRMQKSYSVVVTSAYAKAGSAACFLLLGLGQGGLGTTMTHTAWVAILALTLFSTVLPGVFFLMGLMRLGPVRTAIISTVEPFFTAVLGIVVLHQVPTAGILLGGAMIVAAVVLLTRVH
jgi:drug/metabolite transporter (DMT)-like permease